MIDPRLAWFAIGASCSAVVFGWPWHPRFSRFSRNVRSISTPDPAPDRQPTNPFTGDSVPYYRREYLHSPSTVAECGGPCKAGPEHCHCGQLWRDVPVRFDPGRVQRGNNSGGPTTPKPAIVPKPQFPPPRKISVDWP